MANRGGKICLAAFPHHPVTADLAHLVKNNIYVYGIRGEGRSATRRAMALMAEKRFDATKIHTHTFTLTELPTALRYARSGRGRHQGGRHHTTAGHAERCGGGIEWQKPAPQTRGRADN